MNNWADNIVPMDLVHMVSRSTLLPHRLLLTSIFFVLGYGIVPGMGQLEMIYAGTLEGTVHYLGKRPPSKVLKVLKDQEHCGAEVSIQTVQIHNAQGALSDALVSVEGIKDVGEEAVETERSVVNTRCAFSPRIGVARQGQEIEIRNQDPILHNTHIKHRGRTFLNVAQVPNGNPIVKRLKRSGLHILRCDKHVFMQGSLHVFPHPYYALTIKTGAFRIGGIPPGKHPVRVWHETLGILEKVVNIPEKGAVQITFTYP